MKKYILIILALFTIQIQAQIITDRPDQTESTATVGHGNLQIEAGFQFTSENNDLVTTNTKSLLAPTTLLRYGIGEKFELRLGNQYQVETSQYSHSQIISSRGRGFSDPEIGFKYQIKSASDSPEKKNELAVLAHIALPFGSDDFTNDKLGYIFKLAASHEINEKLGLGYNVGYDYFSSGNGNLTYAMALGIGLGDKLGAFVELYGEYEDLNTFILNGDAGLTYLLKDNLQLDLSFGGNPDPGMFFVSTGFSWLIGQE